MRFRILAGGQPGPDQGREAVSGAEREALEKAESLCDEASGLVREASEHALGTEVRLQAQFESELSAVRYELEVTARRASEAEGRLDRVRAEAAALPPAPVGYLRGAAPDRPAVESEAERIIRTAMEEARCLLVTALAAVERDAALTAATRAQAEQDGQAALAARQEAEDLLRRAARQASAADAESSTARVREPLGGQLAVELSRLRDALERTRVSLDRYVDVLVGSAPAEAPPTAPPAETDRAGLAGTATRRPVSGGV
jgi:hypothetical protein